MSAIRVLMKTILWSGRMSEPVWRITNGVVNHHFVQVVCINITNIPAIYKLTIYSGISSAAIVGILFVVLLIFVLIVLSVFRMHSKQVNRELRETRIKLSESQRKHSSDVSYAEIKDIYDYLTLTKKSNDYESVDYQDVRDQKRYQLEPHSSTAQPEHLYMCSVKWLSSFILHWRRFPIATTPVTHQMCCKCDTNSRIRHYRDVWSRL